MKTIEFKTPFLVGEDLVSKAIIKPMTFGGFAKVSRDAAAARTGNQKMPVVMQRHRMMAQTILLTAADKQINLTEETIARLPAVAGRDIVNNLLDNTQKAGELLSDKDADGISVAIHYKLGVPVKAAAGKEIAELEFMAKDFSNIEEIMTGESPVQQTMDMLSTMARPADGSMLALPSWAAEGISLVDGIFIMEHVLPRFLG